MCYRLTRSRFSSVAQADIGEMMNMVLFPFVGLGRYSSQMFRVQYFEITSINQCGSEVIANVDNAFEVKVSLTGD